jgi:hypothetical protein
MNSPNSFKCIFMILLLGMPSFTYAWSWGTPSFEEITKNKNKYLNEYFSKQSLDPLIVKQISQFQPAIQNFHKITITATDLFDGKESSTHATSVRYIQNLGDGYTRMSFESYNNEIKTSEFIQLGYSGEVLPLRFQLLSYQDGKTDGPVSINKLGKIEYNFTATTPLSSFIMEYATSSQVRFRDICKTGDYFPAAELNKKIPGQALKIECDREFNDNKVAKRTYMYLQDFNLNFLMELKNVNSTLTFVIKDFQIE